MIGVKRELIPNNWVLETGQTMLRTSRSVDIMVADVCCASRAITSFFFRGMMICIGSVGVVAMTQRDFFGKGYKGPAVAPSQRAPGEAVAEDLGKVKPSHKGGPPKLGALFRPNNSNHQTLRFGFGQSSGLLHSH